MNENDKAPTDLTPEQEAEKLEQTVFPEEEYELPEQTAEDIYKDKEAGA